MLSKLEQSYMYIREFPLWGFEDPSADARYFLEGDRQSVDNWTVESANTC